MLKKIVLAALTAAALTMVAPAMASATGTSIPDPVSGDEQAYLADGDGNPEHATIGLAGPLSLNSSTGLVITCQNTATMTVLDDGTAEVTAFNPTGCTTNVPGCTSSVSPTYLSWGSRDVWDPVTGKYKGRVNLYIDVHLGSGCPVSGTFPTSGVLSPTKAVSGGIMTATFSGASSGTVSGAIGTSTVSGTLTSTSGVGADTQLIH